MIFLKPSSTVNFQTIPDESVKCIAVKEDGHQNIMSSVVLKKGIEEPWASERVARFINFFGYKESTLKSDTEPAIVAFRNRVAENCNAEVATEDAVKGDKESNGFLENEIMLLRGFEQSRCHIESRMQEPLNYDSLVMPWLVEHAGCIPSRCQKGRDGEDAILRDCTARSLRKSSSRLEKRCWQDKSQRIRETG